MYNYILTTSLLVTLAATSPKLMRYNVVCDEYNDEGDFMAIITPMIKTIAIGITGNIVLVSCE